jgi:hypothetical protein
MKKFSWKRFNWKFAVIIFFAAIVLDVILEFLVLLGPERAGAWERLIGIPACIVNFPGLPLVPFLRASSDGTVIAILVLSICVLSALFWSVAAGYFFGRKHTA